ncbi:sensor histidine kinase [Streptomyces sp. NPDC088812]|uniref:sensor histidine kinase n=1 Tax=Streptomyces sp. NPDC088812 TaxID=3365905 RepID=UPI00381CBDD6
MRLTRPLEASDAPRRFRPAGGRAPLTMLVLGLVLIATAVAGIHTWSAGMVDAPAAAVALAGWLAFAAWCVRVGRAGTRPPPTAGTLSGAGLLTVTVTAEGLVLTWVPALGAAAAPLLLAAVMSAAAEFSVPLSVGVLACGMLALGCGDLLSTSASTDRWAVAVWTAILTTFHLVGLTRRSARVQHHQLQQLVEQQRQTQQEHQRAAALDERARIAREIHDVLAHSLGALSVQLEAVHALLEAEPPRTRQAARQVRRAREIAVEGLTETRRAITALRSDTAPLADAVRALTDGVRGQHGGPVHAEVAGAERPLPPEVSLCLLRVAQEALGNAAKHAPGRTIDLCLEYEADRVRLTVRSALPVTGTEAADEPGPGGYGLAGMRERLRLVGGTLSAGPGPRGWTVRAEVEA